MGNGPSLLWNYRHGKHIGPKGEYAPAYPIMARLLNDRGDVGFKAGNKLDDFVKPPVDVIQAGPQGSPIGPHLAANRHLLHAAFEHRIKVFRLPAQSHGQRFQRSRAAAALHGMPLDFPHNGRRDMRTVRELALTPAKLTHALADGPCDRGPVFRHAFRHASSSRAPLPAPRLADRRHIPHRDDTNRHEANPPSDPSRNEISGKPPISAP